MANLNEAYNTLVKQQANEIEKLKEGHELIYKALRAAEGVGELMTGPEYECVAESVNHYIHEYHKLTDENEKLKRKINKTVEYMNECCIKNMSEGGVRGFQSWETRCIGSRLIDEIFSSDDEDEEDVD